MLRRLIVAWCLSATVFKWCARAIFFFWHGFAQEGPFLSGESHCLSEEGLCLSEEGLCLTEEGLCLTEEGREIGEGYPYGVNRGRRVRRCKWFWRIAWAWSGVISNFAVSSSGCRLRVILIAVFCGDDKHWNKRAETASNKMMDTLI